MQMNQWFSLTWVFDCAWKHFCVYRITANCCALASVLNRCCRVLLLHGHRGVVLAWRTRMVEKTMGIIGAWTSVVLKVHFHAGWASGSLTLPVTASLSPKGDCRAGSLLTGGREVSPSLLTLFKLCRTWASDTLTDCWSYVGSRFPMDVCDFTWQHEKCKGHKSGSKWKLVHFPWCSLPWINDAMIWASFVAFFPSHVRLAHFLQNKMAASRRRHNLNFISPQRV